MKLDDSNFLSVGLSGKIGSIVFYQLFQKTCGRRAAGSYNKIPTAKQAVQRALFQEARLFAKSVIANPELKAEYAKRANGKRTAFSQAMSEYLKMLKERKNGKI